MRGEFEFVPDNQEAVWKDSYGGYAEDEVRRELEYMAAAIDWCFNPGDGDGDQTSLLVEAMLGASAFIASLPCTCTEDESCARCEALGRSQDKRRDR